MTLIIGHSCGERERDTKAIHSWGKPNRSLRSFPVPTWMYRIFGCFLRGRREGDGERDSWLLAPQSRWTYSPVSVKRAGVLGEAISFSNAMADTKELSVVCLRGARGSFFQRKSYQQSASRRQTMPASDQSAQRRDIHIQVDELQNVLCHRQKRSGEKTHKQDKGKRKWLREGSWECVNIFAIFHWQFPEEISSSFFFI